MEHSQDGKYSGKSRRSSMLAGAIFMSNSITRKECFQRKLFGLPSSHENFVKNIKTGMILFLFDHGERKLYGVFEATSDGSMNIVPDAYLSSGISYPAQVQFKVIWKCMPLFEKEFRHAIKENYYTSVKFNFDLSYDQVNKLILLFSTKKIDSPHESPRIGKKQKKQSEKSNLGKTGVIGKGYPVKSDTNGPSSSDHTNVDRYTSMYELNVNPSKYLGNSFTSSEDLVVGTQLRSYQTSTVHGEPWKSNSMALTPQHDSAFRESSPVSSSYGCREYHIAPGTGSEWPSSVLEMNYPHVGKKLASYTRSALESQNPCLGSQSFSCQRETTKLPSADSLSLDVLCNRETRDGSSVPVCEPSQASLSFSGSKVYNNIQEPYHNSFPDCYDPPIPLVFLSTPGIVVARGTDTLMLDTRNFSEGYQQQESSRQRCGHWNHSPAYIPPSADESLGKHVGASQIFSSKHKDALDNCSLDDCDYSNYEEKSTNHFTRTNLNGANSAMPSFCSDEYQKRTSVFSRLSRFDDDHEQQHEEGEADIYQQLELLPKRTKHWNKKTKVHKQEIFRDADDKSGHSSEMGAKEANCLVDSKSISEAVVDESKIFVNFKRRSDVRKVQMETNEGKHKKRRLIRPSFSEEGTVSKGICESHSMLISSQAIVGGQHDEATQSGYVGETLVEAVKTQETETRQEVSSSSECIDIMNITAQNRGNEMHNNKDPAFSQTSIIQGEGSGTVELSMDLQGCLSDEKATSNDDNVSAAAIISLRKLPSVYSESSGKAEKLSVVCHDIPVSFVEDQMGQKDMILSDGGGKMPSLQKDGDCCHAPLGNNKTNEGKYKKRRLIRPSFSEEGTMSKGICESHSMLISSQAIVGRHHDEATQSDYVGESLVEAVKMQETETRQEVSSSSERTDIMNITAQNCGNEMHYNKDPAFTQTSIILGEGSGTVELSMDLQGCLSDEKATINNDNVSAAAIVSPPKLPTVCSESSGKVEKLSAVCHDVPVNLVDDQMGQKDMVLSDGGGKMRSLEEDGDCCHAPVGNVEGEEAKEAAKFHVVDDGSSVYPLQGLCEGKLNKDGEKNLIVYDESLDYIPLESNVKDVKEITMIDGAENEEHALSVSSVDMKLEVIVFDEFSGKKLVRS